ncbi:unnamed protein product [Effrenium voratum]|uniref:Uncharacterized protein n=1 Tax=Effrenium voratum TaxID=2562239 RepID=A0AA36INP4_9DINO|nr:unnamed protein product [Effrenium voratum]
MWSPPVYFCTRPGQLHAFRSALTELHGNPLRAWFRVLDPDQSLRVTFRGFLRCRLPRSLRLQTEEEMAAVWRAMDTQCQGSCGLRHFSPEAHEAAAGLRRHAAQHGGCAKLLAKLEAQGQVTKPIFRKAGSSGRGAPADVFAAQTWWISVIQ